MAKVIKYDLCTVTEGGEEILSPVKMGWNEANEAIAKMEAYNGKYTIVDDGQPEPEQPESELSVWGELDAAYQEGVDSV